MPEVLEPSSITAAITTTAMSTARSAYSVDDAPRSSLDGRVPPRRVAMAFLVDWRRPPRSHGGRRDGRSGGEAGRGLVEDPGELPTERGHGDDDDDGDQRDEQAVLDRGRAALGLGHPDEADPDVVEDVVHVFSQGESV